MNAYHTFPTCLDAKDEADRPPSKVINRHSIEVFQGWSKLKEPQLYPFAEATLSPAKYALFQLFGYKFMEVIGYLDASTTLGVSVKIGAIGGTMLSLLYLSMLFSGTRDEPRNDSSEVQPSSVYVSLLLQEMLCSALAAVIGSLASGLHDHRQVSMFAVVGMLGPASFLAVSFGTLGSVIGLYWAIERFRDWKSGY